MQTISIAAVADWRHHMTISSAALETSCDQPFDAATYDVMCLVKRRAYELAFAVPHSPPALADGAQPCLHVRVKQSPQGGGLLLSLEEVERFYEDLLQMMHYVQNERQKNGASKPIA
jgi:hypothetical protein